jgi:hypothetical protein
MILTQCQTLLEHSSRTKSGGGLLGVMALHYVVGGVALALMTTRISAIDNGLALTPPMGCE